MDHCSDLFSATKNCKRGGEYPTNPKRNKKSIKKIGQKIMFFGVKNAKLGRKVYNLRPQTFLALKKICQQGTRVSTKNLSLFLTW